jgi:hypothetical protein
MASESSILTIGELAERQLSAYNDANLDAFCACYHRDVVVLDADGEVSLQGIEPFRSRYAEMLREGGLALTFQNVSSSAITV